MAIFDEVKQSGMRGDIVTYSAMISAFAETGDADRALAMLAEMQVNPSPYFT